MANKVERRGKLISERTEQASVSLGFLYRAHARCPPLPTPPPFRRSFSLYHVFPLLSLRLLLSPSLGPACCTVVNDGESVAGGCLQIRSRQEALIRRQQPAQLTLAIPLHHCCLRRSLLFLFLTPHKYTVNTTPAIVCLHVCAPDYACSRLFVAHSHMLLTNLISSMTRDCV